MCPNLGYKHTSQDKKKRSKLDGKGGTVDDDGDGGVESTAEARSPSLASLESSLRMGLLQRPNKRRADEADMGMGSAGKTTKAADLGKAKSVAIKTLTQGTKRPTRDASCFEHFPLPLLHLHLHFYTCTCTCTILVDGSTWVVAKATGKPVSYNHNIQDHDGGTIKAHTAVVHVHQYEPVMSTSADPYKKEESVLFENAGWYLHKQVECVRDQ